MTDVIIRGLRPTDGEALAELYALPQVTRGTLQIPKAHAHLWTERAKDPMRGSHQLVAVLDDRVIGHLGLHLQQNPRCRHTAAIGMAVHDDFHRRGAGGALLDAALELCDRWYGILRVELGVFVDNEPAVALYRSREFEVEGIKRAFGFRDGRYVDTYEMARLRIPEGHGRVEAPADWVREVPGPGA